MFYRHFKNEKIYRVRTRTNFFEEVQPGVPRFAPVTLPEMTADERVSCMSYLFLQARED